MFPEIRWLHSTNTGQVGGRRVAVRSCQWYGSSPENVASVFCDCLIVLAISCCLESMLCAVLIKPPNVTCQTCYGLLRLIIIDLNACSYGIKFHYHWKGAKKEL